MEFWFSGLIRYYIYSLDAFNLYNSLVKQKTRFILTRYTFPLILFVIGAYSLLNYLKAGEFGATNLDVRKLDGMVASVSGEMVKGNTVWGTFHSEFTNLGIISLRFYNQDRDSKDTLLFHLREKGQDKWYYEAKYETDQFLPHKHFPFGFPVISNSDGKNYEFEIESLNGVRGNGISVDYEEHPFFTAKSSYTKTELLGNRRLLSYFVINKLSNIFGDPDIRLNILFYFLPFIFYITFFLANGLSYQYLSLLATIFISYDIFWLTKTYDFIFLAILLLWGLISRRFRFESRIAAVFTLGFMVLVPVMMLFGQEVYAEKTAVWAYLFLSITVIQHIYEKRHTTHDVFTVDAFIRQFRQFEASPDYWMGDISTFLKKFRDFYIYTLNQLSLEAIIRNHPKHERGLIFWLRTLPGLIKKFLVFSAISVLVIFLTALVFYVLILSPVLVISRVLPKFTAFFPQTYLQKYLLTLIAPETLLLIFSFALFKKVAKKMSYALILTILSYNLISGKIVNKAIEFETYPKILSVSPEATSEAWTDVVIYGKNFRNLPFVGKLYIGDIEQGGYMIYWSDEKIIFRTSPELTKSGPIKVVPLDRAPSNTVQFNYLFAK